MAFQTGVFQADAFQVATPATPPLGPPQQCPRATSMTAGVRLRGTWYDLALTEEPTFSRGEQGGYRDATLKAVIPDALRPLLGLAPIEIHGSTGPQYFGDVRSVGRDTLVCSGKQARLDDSKRGCIYRRNGATGWEPMTGARVDSSVGVSVDDNDRLAATYAKSETYKEGWHADWALTFPEPVPSVTFSLVVAGLVANQRVQVYYAQNWSRGWTYWGATTSNGTWSPVAMAASNITGIRLAILNDVNWLNDSFDVTVTIDPTVYGTSVTSTSFANIAAHILAQVTGILPVSEVDASLTTVLGDIAFPTDSGELAKFSELLKFGDWRFIIEPRLVNGVWVPCGVVGPRPTTPRYTLVEDGSSVVFQLADESAEPLCSVVRVRYKDAWDRDRYVDVQDTDPTHPLVFAGITRYHVIDVSTTSAALATAAGARYLIDAGRPQVQGQVLLTGSPNGILACDHQAGELIEGHTQDGRRVVARIADIACKGEHSATLTLDNTPRLDELVFRMAMAKSKTAIRRA